MSKKNRQQTRKQPGQQWPKRDPRQAAFGNKSKGKSLIPYRRGNR